MQARPRKTTDKVWVVYGRDEKRRDAVFTFLRSVGLRPIEWTSALAATKKGSPHVSEVVDTGFEDSGATVVLFTPDDEARLKREFVKNSDSAHEKNLTGQPRQNVLFEAGMAFGRHPDKTILVEVGTLRPISDLVGRHTVRLSNAISTRQQFVVKLRAVGCPVDDTGTDWHTAGDLS
jgi:predicted nucleotide-binding protein